MSDDAQYVYRVWDTQFMDWYKSNGDRDMWKRKSDAQRAINARPSWRWEKMVIKKFELVEVEDETKQEG